MSTQDKVNLEGMDRGTETLEEIEERLSPEAQALVASMARNVEKDVVKKSKSVRNFFRKNRTAWNRMNRKHRSSHMELGMQRILNLVNGKGNVVDSQVPEETDVT